MEKTGSRAFINKILFYLHLYGHNNEHLPNWCVRLPIGVTSSCHESYTWVIFILLNCSFPVFATSLFCFLYSPLTLV